MLVFNVRLRQNLIFAACGIVLVFFISCSATLNPNKFGREDPSQPETPEFTVSAVSLFNAEGQPAVNLNININSKSLIHRIKNKKLVARATIDLVLVNEKNHQTAVSKKYNVEINQALTTDMNELGFHKISKQFDLSSGEYSAVVTVKDEHTSEESTSKISILIKGNISDEPFLTDIQLYGFNSFKDKYESIGSYNLQSKFDTLKVVVQISIPDRVKKPLQIISTLTEFASDTLPARSIGEANYSKSSLHYKGLNYYQGEMVQAVTRKLFGKGKISVEFKYPSLNRGNYRFETKLEESPQNSAKYSYRDFGIRSKSFPLLLSSREKAKTLAYLMSDKEYGKLLSIKDSDSLSTAIDQFWYKHIEDRNKAEEVKQQYFDRVLIANEEFTNFKEGWKTDQGMIFILFGNPWIIDKDFGEETWYYSYNRLDKEKTFPFERTKVFSDSYPFHNYILQRKFLYNNVLYQQKKLWLSGLILTTQI